MNLNIRIARSTGNLIVENEHGERAAIVEPNTGKFLYWNKSIADKMDIDSAVAYYK